MKFGYLVLIVPVLLGSSPVIAQADTLKATIEKALATNPEVLGAVANRLATEKELDGAKGPQYPVIDLHLGSGSERSKTASLTDITLNRQEVGVTLRQTIYDGGVISGEIARQAARLQALDSRVFDVSDTVAQRVADMYLENLKASELYDLAKINLEAHRNYREKIEDRVKAGVAQRADLQLAEGREALASSALTTREAGLEDARIRFRRLVGEMPRGLVRPNSISRTIPALLELAGEIAFANNASFKVAKDEVIAAREAEAAARARFMPVVSLDAGMTRNRNVDGARGQNSDNTLMLMMNYNLFKGGNDKAKIAELGARLTSAMETENNVYRTIEEEVGRAWVALNAAKSSLDFLKNHALHTAEVKDAYQSQFDVGKRTMIDLMNAENEMFQAKSSFISGLYSVEQSEHRLLAAMGGILKIYNIQPTLDPAKAQAEKQAIPEARQLAPEVKQSVPETKQPTPEVKQVAPEVKQVAETEAVRPNAEQQAEEKARQAAEAKVAKLKAKKEAKAEAARLKAEKKAKVQAEKQAAAEAKKVAQAEAARLKAEQEAQTAAEAEPARLKAEQEAEEKMRQAAEAKVAKLKAKEDAKAEAARLKAEKKAKVQAEKQAAAEARKVAQAEAARLKAEQEAQTAAEAEPARLKAEQEAEEKTRQAAEAKVAKLKAKEDAKAEAARLKAEKKAKAQAEKQAAAEAKQKAKVEAKIQAVEETKQATEDEAANLLLSRIQTITPATLPSDAAYSINR